MPFSRLSAMKKWKPKHSRSPSSIFLPSLACAACHASTTLCMAPPSAEPPPTMPWIPCLAMNSIGRGALDRLPALDRQPQRPRHESELLQGVAAVGHLGRQRVVLALVGEGLLV